MTKSQSLAPLLDDAPTAENKLPGFEGYVNALAGILMDPNIHTPLTLGIFGDWGSGKTSLMLQLKKEVTGGKEGRPTHRAVWFNAWKYNQEDALWRALLLVLLDDLAQLLAADPPPAVAGEPDPQELLERLRAALYRDTSWTEKGERHPDWTAALTAGAGLAFNLVLSGVGLGLVDTVMDEARKTLGKGEPVSQLSKLAQAFKREDVLHTQAQLRSLEQFQANFARLVDMLVRRTDGKKRKLVIFVDDLDRCTPDKAMQVLEALKLFLDVPGCIVVLALSAQEIENAVLLRYQGKVNPKEYLEKIIQVPFIIPPIENEAMQQYVEQLAPALPDQRCAQVFAQGLGEPNPRQVKRVLNIFLLLSRLLNERPDLLQSITPVRLAKFVTLQHAHPEFYELLRHRSSGYLPQLEHYFRTVKTGERPTPGAEANLPQLPEALQEFQADETLRRLLCLFEEEDARFDDLKPLDVRSYITFTKRSTPLEMPAVHIARLPFEPELVPIPAGAFWMGTSDEQITALRARYDWAKDFDFSDEQPQLEITLPAYAIGRYPVTNAEYAEFVRATGHRAPSHWRGDTFPEELADHPVVYVNWHDAQAYVQWLREKTDQDYRLPTEAEWEKAASGENGLLWPWGDEWDAQKCNMKLALWDFAWEGHI